MPEQPQNQDKEAEKIIAYHEAGHVLMNYYLGWKVSSFGFVDETKTHGITNSDKSADKDYQWVASLKSLKEATDDERELIIAKKENRALLAMAGEVSQKKFRIRVWTH